MSLGTPLVASILAEIVLVPHTGVVIEGIVIVVADEAIVENVGTVAEAVLPAQRRLRRSWTQRLTPISARPTKTEPQQEPARVEHLLRRPMMTMLIWSFKGLETPCERDLGILA
jgi:hypothetical protein